LKAIITGTGSSLPEKVVKNSHFSDNIFYEKSGEKTGKSGAEFAEKLETITGIRERRYIRDDEDSVPLMTAASRRAIDDAGIEVNDIQGIIVAHNAGNMLTDGRGIHSVPNMAALLKNALKVENHDCFAYDLLFGCPGWLQSVIQAKQVLADDVNAQNILVVGVEVASRFLDPHDLDSMILADGCGACIVSKSKSRTKGILSYATYSHAQADLKYIYQNESLNAEVPGSSYFKMSGRDVYKYATTWLPQVIKNALDKAGKTLDDVDIFLFHQANGKMLQAIAQNLATLYGQKDYNFEGKIPTTIEVLGNTSVATIPTLMDMVLKNQIKGYKINKGQLAVMASVGAGMHCNALVYQF
jgi:3-oxoacyl-[acyl-carrier-protein] synthase-3